MRLAVITAVLLLVCILDTVTAGRSSGSYQRLCDIYPDSPCGDGWSRIDGNRCAKLIRSQKTFDEAQEHCSTLNGDLASINSANEMIQVLCLTRHADSHIWIGTSRSERGFRYMDGSKLKYYRWFLSEANSDGQKDCVEFKVDVFINWNNVHCSEKRDFVCTKKM